MTNTLVNPLRTTFFGDVFCLYAKQVKGMSGQSMLFDLTEESQSGKNRADQSVLTELPIMCYVY